LKISHGKNQEKAITQTFFPMARRWELTPCNLRQTEKDGRFIPDSGFDPGNLLLKNTL
jgi:hypothetical protein